MTWIIFHNDSRCLGHWRPFKAISIAGLIAVVGRDKPAPCMRCMDGRAPKDQSQVVYVIGHANVGRLS